MFKALTIFSINGDAPEVEQLRSAVSSAAFSSCGATQMVSSGWVPPRNLGFQLVEKIGEHLMLSLQIEQRIVPAQVVAREVEKKVKQIEHETGRAPGKKARRELKDEAIVSLMPQAFTRIRKFPVWIDLEKRRLMIGSALSAVSDIATGLLVSAYGKLNISMIVTIDSPEASMASWLMDEPPSGFTVDGDAHLQGNSEGDGKTAVKYVNSSLDAQDVLDHIKHGKRPTSMSLTHSDSVSFVLGKDFKLRKIHILDGVIAANKDESAEAFDADVAISAPLLSAIIDGLIESMGGEAKLPIESTTEASQ